MPMELSSEALGLEAEADFSAVAEVIGAGDELATKWVRDVGQQLRGVTQKAREATRRAAQLHQDDVSNPAGVQRMLAEIPGNLRAATDAQLKQAADTLTLIREVHTGGLLRRDPKDDPALQFEVTNYVAALTKETAPAALKALCENPRYASFMAGPAGLSLAARFEIRDASIFERTALAALGTEGVGSPEQVARSRALAKIDAGQTALGKARGARDFAAEESQRPPARKPTAAMF